MSVWLLLVKSFPPPCASSYLCVVPPYVVDSSPHGPENVIVVVIIIIVIAAALDLLHDVLLAGREVHPLELLAAAILLVLPFGGAASVGDAEEKRDEEDCELGHFAIDG